MRVTIEHQPAVIPETVRMKVGQRVYTMDEIAAIVAQHHEDEAAASTGARVLIGPPIAVEAHHDGNFKARVNGVDVPGLKMELLKEGKWLYTVHNHFCIDQDAHPHQWLWLLAQVLIGEY